MVLKANNLVSAGNVLVIYSFAANQTIRKRDIFFCQILIWLVWWDKTYSNFIHIQKHGVGV